VKNFVAMFVALIMGLFLFGCSGNNNAKVITADIVEASLSSAVISTFDCVAIEVVKADVKTNVDKWFQLDQQRQKGIVQDLCKTAIAEIVPSLIGTALPATWQCKNTKVDTAAAILANLACSTINV
jgi:hypothetical protein